MKYEFNFTIDHNDLFNYSLNNMRYSKTFIFDIIFTIVVILVTIYMIITGKFNQLSDIKKLLLITCCLLFPLIQPIMLYIKTGPQAKKLDGHNFNLRFDDDKITASTDNEKSEITYDNVYNFIKYKNMIVVMYSATLGQIIPNRAFNINRDEFYNFVSSRINDARKNKTIND